MEVGVASGIESVIPDRFIPLDQLESLELGKSYWLKVEILELEDEKHILSVGNAYMRDVRIYTHEKKLIKVGNSVSVDPNTTYYLFYSFYDFKDANLFSVSILTYEDWVVGNQKDTTFEIVFLSILGFILLVVMVFAFGKDNLVYRNYGYYIGTMFLFFAYQYGFLGATITFFNKISPSWVWISSAFISHGYLLFSRSFLDLRKNDSVTFKLTKFFEYYILGVILVESVSLLLNSNASDQIWFRAFVIGFQFILMAVYLYRIVLMRTLLSNIFLIGSLVLLISSLGAQVASVFGITNETNIFVQSGLLLDVFILMIGLFIRTTLMQRAKDEMQANLIEQLKINERLQQEYTEELEAKVTERTLDLDSRNRENETLLKEVHHRVKNNLQMINSLLNMQQRRLKSPQAKEALSLTKGRVKSIGLIHEHLYQFEDFSSIKLNTYVEELVNMIIKTSYKGSKLQTHLDITEKSAHIETAMPIGIILNELIINSLKYGIEGETPELKVAIWEENEILFLRVSDTGSGVKSGNSEKGFGQTIILTLLEGCNGGMETKTDETGYHVIIKIKDYTFT